MANTMRFFRPGIILRNKFSLPTIRLDMVVNYIKIAFRTFSKQKSYTVLNVLGLAIGMAASLLIFQYVTFERSFDRFHANAGQLYRVQYNAYSSGALNFESALAVPAVGPALKNNFPEVDEFTRLFPNSSVMIVDDPVEGKVKFHEQRMFWADPAIFRVFDMDVLKGNPATALDGENKTVISSSTAQKYFGNDDPIGKRISWNGQEDFEVTAVVRDMPENSHIKFSFLLSYATVNRRNENRTETDWYWYDFYTYIKVSPGTDLAALQSKWNAFLEKERKADWDKYNGRQEFVFQPVVDIHLYSNLLYEALPAEARDGDAVHALAIIALFILAIAWVNYINLATARALNRANEVGVRKVVGAARGQLITQFITESVILNVMAVTLALAVVRLVWPSFAALTGWQIPLSFMMQPGFWLAVGALIVGGALLSGIYPAVVLSSFKPVLVLKGKIAKASYGHLLRKSLVVFQFAASVFLISGSAIVYQQLQFMKNRDLGMDINQTIVLQGPQFRDSLYASQWASFKSEALRIPGVRSVVSGSSVPGNEIYWTEDLKRISGSKKEFVTTMNAIDHEYFDAFGIRIVAGRGFVPEQKATARVIINEELVRVLDFRSNEEAVGDYILWRGDSTEIIGVVQNFHQMSLKSPVAPLAFLQFDAGDYFAIKIESTNYQGVIEALREHFQSTFSDLPFDYFFLDEFYNRQYDKDMRFGQVFAVFTALAILIACMGLFGLASFMALQRTKEIGIRKVLGSTIPQIVVLLTRGFLQPVLLANLIAWPVAWWIMNEWLQAFPYHVNIQPIVFVVAGLVVAVIALLSVGSQTLKAAMIQPAKTLKYE